MNGALPVLNRRMQEIPVAVVVFYVTLISSILLSLALLIESLVKGEQSLRIVSYSATQYSLVVTAALLYLGMLVFRTVAQQNEKSGFITMLAYISLIYGFLGDLVFFKEPFSAL